MTARPFDGKRLAFNAAVIPALIMLRAWVVFCAWAWFIEPTTGRVADFGASVGIVMVAFGLTFRTGDDKDPEDIGAKVRRFRGFVLMTLLAIALFWLFAALFRGLGVLP